MSTCDCGAMRSAEWIRKDSGDPFAPPAAENSGFHLIDAGPKLCYDTRSYLRVASLATDEVFPPFNPTQTRLLGTCASRVSHAPSN
jgi:hypothetical protein